MYDGLVILGFVNFTFLNVMRYQRQFLLMPFISSLLFSLSNA